MLTGAVSRLLMSRVAQNIRRIPIRCHNFGGDQTARATTVTMLSKEEDEMTYIEAYSPLGFRLKTGFKIIGPCAVFPRSILHWNVTGAHDISVDSLSLFTMLEPKIDLLILGIGDSGVKYDKEIVKYLRSHKINVEILPTDRACSTFNFLNAERRYVAGALIPPSYMHIEHDEDALVRAQLERRNLYEMDQDYHEPSDEPGMYDEALQNLKEWTKGGTSRDDPKDKK